MDINKAVIARLRKNEQTFEILVDCEKAIEFKKNPNMDINDVLAVFKIFKDAKKGDIAPNLQEIFQTDDAEEIAKNILMNGEVQINTAYKKKLVDEKKEKIIGIIMRTAMDPIRKIPIPRTRIEIAMEQIHTHINPFKPAEAQLEEIIEKLRPILPLSFENKKYEIIIPARHASACYGILKKYGKIKSEEWLPSGALKANIETPAGLSEEFENSLNKKTTGDIQIKTL